MRSDDSSIYHVRCYVNPFQNLYQFSHLYCGLSLLAHQGVAQIVLQQRPKSANYACDFGALWAEVLDSRNHEKRKVVFDMYDDSGVFASDCLELCDVYFKRSYHEPDVRQLSPKLQPKVMPFGINFGCQTPETTLRLLSVLLPSWTWKMFKSPRETIRRLRAAS